MKNFTSLKRELRKRYPRCSIEFQLRGSVKGGKCKQSFNCLELDEDHDLVDHYDFSTMKAKDINFNKDGEYHVDISGGNGNDHVDLLTIVIRRGVARINVVDLKTEERIKQFENWHTEAHGNDGALVYSKDLVYMNTLHRAHVCSEDLVGMKTLHYDLIETPFGQVVVNFVSPSTRGMKAITFWNFTKEGEDECAA
ncbi:hypothetical protein ACXWTF_12955 [Thiomicrolovo sp. ZZH C-3]